MGEKPDTKRNKPPHEAMEVDDVPGGIERHKEEDVMRLLDIRIPPPPEPLAGDTSPRVILNHIVTHNFKNFNGSVSFGMFHKRFTSLFGSSESGHSNVIEGLRFVFQHPLHMPPEAISQLIHSEDCETATVQVHFRKIIDGQDEDSFTIVPGSELMVSRCVSQDGTTFHMIDDKIAVFEEVKILLRSLGIDLYHNRMLTFPDFSSNLAGLGPMAGNGYQVGMLEYLENIMATDKYTYSIRKLESILDVLNQQWKENLNLVSAAEAEWERCNEPYAAARDRVAGTHAAIRGRNFILQKYIHENRKIYSKQEAALNVLKQALAKTDEKLSRLRDEVRRRQAARDADRQRHNKLSNGTSKTEATKKLQVCYRKRELVAETINAKNLKKENLDQLLEQHKETLSELERLSKLFYEDPVVGDSLKNPGPLNTFTAAELEAADLEDLRQQHEALKSKLGGQAPNLADIQMYKSKEDAYFRQVQDMEKTTTARNRIQALKDDLTKRRLDEFNAGLAEIRGHVKGIYGTLTQGGHAELEPLDPMNPFSEGITFRVRPPNKSWMKISELSEGDRILSCLSLVFGLQTFKPSPFYVMHEVVAGLDRRSVAVVAYYIKFLTITQNVQYILSVTGSDISEMYLTSTSRYIKISRTEDSKLHQHFYRHRPGPNMAGLAPVVVK